MAGSQLELKVVGIESWKGPGWKEDLQQSPRERSYSRTTNRGNIALISIAVTLASGKCSAHSIAL